MQGAEDEQARFRGGERELDGFQVAHFADEHDVGVFTERGFQAVRESGRVVRRVRLLADLEILIDVFEGVNRFDVSGRGMRIFHRVKCERSTPVKAAPASHAARFPAKPAFMRAPMSMLSCTDSACRERSAFGARFNPLNTSANRFRS